MGQINGIYPKPLVLRRFLGHGDFSLFARLCFWQGLERKY
jgi:hypothetical protein